MSLKTDSSDLLYPCAILAAVVSGLSLALLVVPDYFKMVLPIAAFGAGFAFRPRHIWVIWAASLAAFTLIVGFLLMAGLEPPKATQDVIASAGSFAMSSELFAVYLAALAGVPLWLGRMLAHRRIHV